MHTSPTWHACTACTMLVSPTWHVEWGPWASDTRRASRLLLGKQCYSLEGSDQVRLCMSCIRTGKKEFLVIIVYVPWSFEGHGKKFGKNCFITLADALVLLQSPPTVARPNSLVLFYLFFENLIQVYNVSRLYHTRTSSLPGLSLISLSTSCPRSIFYYLLI